MKSHKYSSFASFILLILAIVAEFLTDSKIIHVVLEIGTLVAMIVSIYSGHKIVLDKKKADK